MRVAIIGSGVAGMTAAYRLHQQGHEITLYEANDYYGGHTATIDIEHKGQHWAIDTGFIVYNDWTYPNFINLLNELHVEWQYSNMSFSLRCEQTGLEYNGTSVNSLFAQRLNALRPSFLRMIYDILRFNKRAQNLIKNPDHSITLSEYLLRHHYSKSFIEQYIIPMGRAIWSASESSMLSFPAHFFVDFFNRHGFLNVNNRPVWRVVKGGSREYARKLVASFQHRIRLNSPVISIHRTADCVNIGITNGHVERYDYVVMACHSDQALKILDQPTPLESEILGAFPYQENAVTLHTDIRMLPRTPRARAAWNYHLLSHQQDRVALTYDMNVLQNIISPTKFLVTLNRDQDIDPRTVLGRYVYHHPVYTPKAVHAQKRHGEINGLNRSFYCGAYWGHGFHEDGVVSALRMLDQFKYMAQDHHSSSTLPSNKSTPV